MIAARDDVDEAVAKRRAVETWRLAQAYLDDHDGQPPPVHRRTHLKRTALARAWLRDDFEATFDRASVPDDAVATALTNPRILHPRVHVICQVIVTPPAPSEGPPPQAPDDPRWRAAAQRHANRIAGHLRTYLPAPGEERDCEYFNSLIALEPTPAADDRWPRGMELRVESGVFETCRDDQWDAGFVSALCETDAPGIHGPFWTRYGAHVVAAIDVAEDNRPAGDDEREAVARGALLDDWRRSQYPGYIERLRAHYDVREISEAP